jgi:hypothetical protein
MLNSRFVGHSEKGTSRKPDREREVLVLYRERSGEESFGNAEVLSAGAFSIQH